MMVAGDWSWAEVSPLKPAGVSLWFGGLGSELLTQFMARVIHTISV